MTYLLYIVAERKSAKPPYEKSVPTGKSSQLFDRGAKFTAGRGQAQVGFLTVGAGSCPATVPVLWNQKRVEKKAGVHWSNLPARRVGRRVSTGGAGLQSLRWQRVVIETYFGPRTQDYFFSPIISPLPPHPRQTQIKDHARLLPGRGGALLPSGQTPQNHLTSSHIPPTIPQPPRSHFHFQIVGRTIILSA